MDSDPASSRTVSILLDESQSDSDRLSNLLPLVYDQLRAIAERAMSTERPDHTLQATALAHEAFLKLVGARNLPWSNKSHFYVAAAEAMRRILIDHARSRGRAKRGGDRTKLSLDSVADLAARDSSEILGFDELFRRLESELPEAAAVVRLRFYAGLTIDQTAKALDVSSNTVDGRSLAHGCFGPCEMDLKKRDPRQSVTAGTDRLYRSHVLSP